MAPASEVVRDTARTTARTIAASKHGNGSGVASRHQAPFANRPAVCSNGTSAQSSSRPSTLRSLTIRWSVRGSATPGRASR